MISIPHPNSPSVPGWGLKRSSPTVRGPSLLSQAEGKGFSPNTLSPHDHRESGFTLVHSLPTGMVLRPYPPPWPEVNIAAAKGEESPSLYLTSD